MRGAMYRGQPFQGDLEKCNKPKEDTDLSDLATGLGRRQPNAAAPSDGGNVGPGLSARLARRTFRLDVS